MGIFDSLGGMIGGIGRGGANDPISKGNIGDTISTIGGITKSFGAAQSYGANAQAEAMNAAIIRANTVIKLTAAGRAANKATGAIQAGYAGAGLAKSGSVLDVLAENARNASEEQANITKLGAMEAGVHDIASKAAAKQAKKSKLGGILGAVGAVGGFLIGGPSGATVGAQIGGLAGQTVG